MTTVLCENCYPEPGDVETLTFVPITACVVCGGHDYRNEPGGLKCTMYRTDPRAMTAWPPVKNVYASQFTAEQIKAATDKNGCLCVSALNEIRFRPADNPTCTLSAERMSGESFSVYPSDFPPIHEAEWVPAEQQARDMLERLGMPGAQSLSAGDVAELAELIANQLTQKK